MDRLNSARIWRRESRKDTHPIPPQQGNVLQVGLNSSSSSGIGSCNRQYSLHFDLLIPHCLRLNEQKARGTQGLTHSTYSLSFALFATVIFFSTPLQLRQPPS